MSYHRSYYKIKPEEVHPKLFKITSPSSILESNKPAIQKSAAQYFEIMSDIEFTLMFAILNNDDESRRLFIDEIKSIKKYFEFQNRALSDQQKAAKYLFSVLIKFCTNIEESEKYEINPSRHAPIQVKLWGLAHSNPKLNELRYVEMGGRAVHTFFIFYFFYFIFLQFNVDRNTFPELGIKEFFDAKSRSLDFPDRLRDEHKILKTNITSIWNGAQPYFGRRLTVTELFERSGFEEIYQNLMVSESPGSVGGAYQVILPFIPMTQCFGECYIMPELASQTL